MPSNSRDAILDGFQFAVKAHQELGIRDQVISNGGSVNVFANIDQKGYGLLFRPLEGILGLCMQKPAPGILITTNRSLSVQRFTAAHEFGHLEMGHAFSIDSEDDFNRSTGFTDVELQEVAANAFSAGFLMPKWLIKEKMTRQGWSVEQLSNPAVVYQLSLRMGVSYDATCRSLSRYKWINQQTEMNLLGIQPKQIKNQLLNGEALKDPWADVWLLSENDHTEIIEAGPTDVFILNLTEHGSGGYLWNVDELEKKGFRVQSFGSIPNEQAVGGPVKRSWALSSDSPLTGNLKLEERRPWQPDDLVNQLVLSYSLLGKEVGLPRYLRSQPLVA